MGMEPLNLEIEQTSIMLVPDYDNWVVPEVNKGKFLNEFTQQYDILPFRFWSGKASEAGIGAISRNLPNIFFKCNLRSKYFHAILENSDIFYKARLLQYQKSNTHKISSGKYTYFEGTIGIDPQS